jgi:signal transduction histidine kinase
VLAAYADQMSDFHHVAVPIAVAVIVPAWALELGGVRWPRLALVAATVLPNLWLTAIGHTSTNYLWLGLLVVWVGFAGSLAEGLVALAASSATVALAVIWAPPGAASWVFWIEYSFVFATLWFTALVMRQQVSQVAELRRLRSQAEELAVLRERQRLARELHDSVTQSLYGISLHTEAATRALSSGESAPVASNLQEIRETTRDALGEMRLLLFELRAPILQEQGLAAALRARLQVVEARSDVATTFECDGNQRLPPEHEQELYRIAQEALNNVLKHAHAGRVDVRLALLADRATLEVVDDGVGFEPGLASGHGFGLPGMRERVERVGGTLQIHSAAGAGTRVHVEVRLRGAQKGGPPDR